MIVPSLSASLAQLQALANYIDQGSANATFVFYSNTKPENIADPADSAAKLVTLTLPKPALKKVNADSVELNQTDAATIIKTGTAQWARLFNGEGKAVADFAVGTDITLANPELVLGSTLMMNSLILRPSI
ncbi:hypothetical protein ACINWCA157_1485 [Acinetobacter radioresistens WC-A-157]|uniref:hypothetical protein n=1 Tax=Acinetobacter radioresistens TaxID=40216 RepID=UPI000277BFDB|nr:hypothetical protein [Acinetobacter radioresistens]EJO35853.1 hypothetical protein ACINWCA157_1485 [Acinetobacter radioresistens WC-A-157]